jgi:predicted nucleic acid-binding protein
MNKEQLTIKIEVAKMAKSDTAKVNIKLGDYPAVADHNVVIDLTNKDKATLSSSIFDLSQTKSDTLIAASTTLSSLLVAITATLESQREQQLDRESISLKSIDAAS